MEESLSWRARLAKANINILYHQDSGEYNLFIEFTYHPKPGVFKWCKTIIPRITDPEKHVDYILDEVLKLRKELEG